MNNDLPSIKTQKQKINDFYNDPNISSLLQEELNQIRTSQYGSQYTISLISEKLHLYLYFYKNGKKQQKFNHKYEESTYVIRIGKSFPLESVRVHILNNGYVPKIFDCRDVLEEILQTTWDYKKRLIAIIQNVGKFQSKLIERNRNPQAMQITGKFILNDLYSYQQLVKFSTLDIFHQHQRDSVILLGTTETHFLIFTAFNSKYNAAYSNIPQKLYQLSCACELQCIREIDYNEKKSEILITLCKYKAVEHGGECERMIMKKFNLQNPEGFLRNILKNIAQFQKISINLTAHQSLWKSEQGFDIIEQKIQECKQVQQRCSKNEYKTQKQKLQIKKILVEHYQKIISYFSERASSYYLIFVHKLNQLYRIDDNYQNINAGQHKKKKNKSKSKKTGKTAT